MSFHLSQFAVGEAEKFLSAFPSKTGMVDGMNFSRTVALLFGAGMVGFASIPTAQGGDLAQEYNQVRQIALKDPKVRAAFERANEKLNKRIIEIDPALKPFVEGQGAGKKSREATKKSLRAPSSAGATHSGCQR